MERYTRKDLEQMGRDGLMELARKISVATGIQRMKVSELVNLVEKAQEDLWDLNVPVPEPNKKGRKSADAATALQFITQFKADLKAGKIKNPDAEKPAVESASPEEAEAPVTTEQKVQRPPIKVRAGRACGRSAGTLPSGRRPPCDIDEENPVPVRDDYSPRMRPDNEARTVRTRMSTDDERYNDHYSGRASRYDERADRYDDRMPRERMDRYADERLDRYADERQDRGAGRRSRYEREESDYYYEPEEPEVVKERVFIYGTGVLDILPDGYGFLRGRTYKPETTDIFVPTQIIKRFALRPGDLITGVVRGPKNNESFCGLLKVTKVNGMDPEQAKRRARFEQFTPIFPNERYTLETASGDLSARILDLFSPIGKGQRALIVSAPKSGKTIMLKKIAQGIAANFPKTKIIALLVDERPEEVTDMCRTISGEVVASTFDEAPDQHIRISTLVMERARRMVELGEDVVIMLDSLTRLGRACNKVASPSGRTLSGGLDVSALRMPNEFFCSARNIENGGSLTIIATALIDTGSKMDDIIFEEFKGRGNMEVDLSRRLAESRIFPAIDIRKSGTRNEDRLLDPATLNVMNMLRRSFEIKYEEQDPTGDVLNAMKKYPTNEAFLSYLYKTAQANSKN